MKHDFIDVHVRQAGGGDCYDGKEDESAAGEQVDLPFPHREVDTQNDDGAEHGDPGSGAPNSQCEIKLALVLRSKRADDIDGEGQGSNRNEGACGNSPQNTARFEFFIQVQGVLLPGIIEL